MSNNLYNNNQFCKLYLTNIDYWDISLTNHNNDTCCTEYSQYNILDIDLSEPITGNTISSLITWDNAVNNGVILNDIGFTGLDNGLLTYEKDIDDYSNINLLNTITGSTIELISGDTKMYFHNVTGSTTNIEYPIYHISGQTSYNQFCGGFLQGVYKLQGYDYDVLPNRYEEGVTIEYYLIKNNCNYSGTTLNDLYPNNKGFIFYFGTRAEDKYHTCFGGLNTGNTCESGSTYFCSDIKENELNTSSNIPFCNTQTDYIETDNKFTFFNRTKDGTTTCDYSGQTTTLEVKRNNPLTENKFINYNRTHTGTTTCDDEAILNNDSILKDYKKDTINNVFGIYINDEGCIGYKTIDFDCDNEYIINDVLSDIPLINEDVWYHLIFKIVYNKKLTECDLVNKPIRKGKLMVYINGYLKYTFNDFKEIVPFDIDNDKEKVQSVAYNISIGGGSQGLLESITLDGQDPSDLNLIIEQNFAGTFIGGINKFKIYDKPLTFCQIKEIFNNKII